MWARAKIGAAAGPSTYARDSSSPANSALTIPRPCGPAGSARGPVGGGVGAGEQRAEGRPGADGPRQALRAAVARQQAERHLGRAEPERAPGRVAQVARQRHLEAAAERV